MKLSKTEQDVIEYLRNISDQNSERIHSILQALMKFALMEYAEGHTLTIPYFGTLMIRNLGDVKTEKGVEADLQIFFNPSDFLKQNIGFYEDYKKGLCGIMDIPVFKLLDKEDRVLLKNNLTGAKKEVEKSL